MSERLPGYLWAVILRLFMAISLILVAGTSRSETRYICWRGANGYTMTGKFQYPDDLAGRPLIRESDLLSFRIQGFLDAKAIGRWSLEDVGPETSWLLRYDPVRHIFPLTDPSGLYQMWNANGQVDDCGTPGFGFNAGNGGQDVCIDDTFVTSSTIDPATPLISFPRPQPADCTGQPLLGKAR
jgi:hypothetical protein